MSKNKLTRKPTVPDSGEDDRTRSRPERQPGRSTYAKRRSKTSQSDKLSDNFIYGLHASEFALRNSQRNVTAIWATENAEHKLSDAIRLRDVAVTRVSPRELDKRLGGDSVHQGIVLEVAPLPLAELGDVADRATASGQPILLLDQVTDPHNVGAILRSCAVFGAAGLIMTQRHSPPLGGTLAKSASGALDLMPVCLVQNLSVAIGELQQLAISVIGLDGTGEHRLLQDGLAARKGQTVALALGAEGRGLRALTMQSCDELCRIGGDGPIASLNVSNAAAIALHLAAMQRLH